MYDVSSSTSRLNNDGKDVRGDDGAEASPFDDNVWLGSPADFGDHGADELAFAITIGPDHQVGGFLGFGEQVRLDAAVVGVLRRVLSFQHRRLRLETRLKLTCVT